MTDQRPSQQKERWIGKRVIVTIDRPLGSVHPNFTAIKYPINYGYISNTHAADGHEIDAYVLGVDKPVEAFEGQCIAIIHRLDDNEDKLVVVSFGQQIADEDIISQTDFQEKFFNSILMR